MIVDTLDPTRANMPEYLLVFTGERQANEHAFSAISDEQAETLSRKQFPGVKWLLYRVASGSRTQIGSQLQPGSQSHTQPAHPMQPVAGL